MVKKIAIKTRNSVRHIRTYGLISFGVVALQKLEAKVKRGSTTHKREIHLPVMYDDALVASPGQTRAPWPGTSRESLRFNWLMPPPGKGSGGHHNIFRFIKFLEEAGHENRIYLYSNSQHGPIADIEAIMGDSYPVVKAKMEWLEPGNDMREADGMFATSWETAYPSFNSQLTAKRFYFVQDFEPYFYPVGSMSALAENTYRFGFFGITAGGWLAKKLHTEYGMRTDHYDFGADTERYHYLNDQPRKELLFYVRPFTERRGFELGIMALDLFHRRHPEYVINLAGWDVSEHAIPFPYRNLKTLELSELNALYNRCAAGVVLSFTNMSLLPLELLGSGTIPVVNAGENNRLVSDNPYIAYSATDPVALAETLGRIVTRPDAAEYARAAAGSVAESSWAVSGRKFVNVIETETRNHE